MYGSMVRLDHKSVVVAKYSAVDTSMQLPHGIYFTEQAV